MKILFLSKKPPYPPKDGEAIAIANIMEGLMAKGHEIRLLYMNTRKFSTDESIFETKEIKANVSFVNTDINFVAAFKNLFSKQSYNIKRFISDEYAKQLESILVREEFDIIQLETIYLMPYVQTIRHFSKAKIVLRTHNVESQIWERLANNLNFGLKKWYLNVLAKRLKKYEKSILNTYDALVPITTNDLDWYQKSGNNKPVFTLPITLDTKKYKRTNNLSDKLSCFFLGSLDWQPNIEGLKWYLEEVQEQLLDVALHIAGRNGDDSLKNTINTHFVGEVDSAIDFMNKHHIMIVPLFSGSGIRVKIVEAMALGKVVITTTIGAEGIDYINGKHLLIADDKIAFKEQIRLLHEHKSIYETIAENAQALVKEKYDSDSKIKALAHFYQKI